MKRNFEGALYHRLTFSRENPEEIRKVRDSSQLWGRARRNSWGNGPPCVKAYLGALPSGRNGYTFRACSAPTRTGKHMGNDAAFWNEDDANVEPVPGHSGCVFIWVEIVDDV